jgi:hypothetical protein
MFSIGIYSKIIKKAALNFLKAASLPSRMFDKSGEYQETTLLTPDSPASH